MKNEVKLFEQQKVRTHWDEEKQKWFFRRLQSLVNVKLWRRERGSNPRWAIKPILP